MIYPKYPKTGLDPNSPALPLGVNPEPGRRASVTWTPGMDMKSGQQVALTAADVNDILNGQSTQYDDAQFPGWYAGTGVCTNFYWKLENGVLSVVGTGDLLTTRPNTAYAGFPWYTRGAEIETVILIGFTTIGTGAFYSPQLSQSYRNIKQFIVSEGVTTLQDSTFGSYSGNMNTHVDLHLPSTLTTIAARAFRNMDNWVDNIYVSPALNVSQLSVGANNPTKLRNKDFITESYEHLYVTAYPFYYDGTDDLEIGLRDAQNRFPVTQDAELGDYTWRVSITVADFGKTIECTPHHVDSSGVYYFSTSTATGENQFIPWSRYDSGGFQAYTDYTVQVDICDKSTGDILYRSECSSGFIFPIDRVCSYPADSKVLSYFNGSAYVEGDLGDSRLLCQAVVKCTQPSSAYTAIYMFCLLGSNDNTLPISAWDSLGAQYAITSIRTGYVVNIFSETPYRYIRLYPVAIPVHAPYDGGTFCLQTIDVMLTADADELYRDAVVGYTNPNLHRRIAPADPEPGSAQVAPNSYSLQILGTDSYRTTRIHVHDEESTTSEVP